MSSPNIISALEKSLPAVFGRSAVLQFLPGVIAPGTLANLDSQKAGPPCHRARGKVIYEKASFLAWLAEWLSLPEPSTSSDLSVASADAHSR